MLNNHTQEEIIQKLASWGEKQPAVRAAILTSSRTVPGAPVDPFSDYDVIYVVAGVYPFFSDRTWLEAFGPVLTLYHDPVHQEDGFDCFAHITHYQDGLKIDFIFLTVDWLRWVTCLPELPEDLNLGYTILLDKDGLTKTLKPPTHQAYLPKPPAAPVYNELVETFYSESCYAAKHLWRGDLIPLKNNFDHEMKFVCLRKMIEWHAAIGENWSVKTTAYGKGLKKRVRPDIWAEFERTYVGADWAQNWEALFRTIGLFRRVGIEVGEALGFAYPEGMHQQVLAYLERVRALEKRE